MFGRYWIGVLYLTQRKTNKQQKLEIMTTVTIQSVKDYNQSQLSTSMKFQNEDGSLKKIGFVVSFNGRNKFAKNKKEAQQITTKDFERSTPNYWNDANMSNVEWINQ